MNIRAPIAKAVYRSSTGMVGRPAFKLCGNLDMSIILSIYMDDQP